MSIPSEKKFTINGATKTIPVNGDYAFVQMTLTGRNTSIVTATARLLLENNAEEDFLPDEFEFIEGGEINLGENPRKRTFTIECKRLSTIRFADAGVGVVNGYLRQWGRIAN